MNRWAVITILCMSAIWSSLAQSPDTWGAFDEYMFRQVPSSAVVLYTNGDYFVAINGAGRGTNGWADATNSISGAMSKCPSNSTVYVSNGTYVLTGLTIPKYRKLRSISDLPNDVVLNGNASGRIITMGDTASDQQNTWVIGCTISNGSYGGNGGGIYGGSASNCVFVKNFSSAYGGAAQAAFLYNCLVINNTANAGGPAGNSVNFWSCTTTGNIGPCAMRCGDTIVNCISWNASPDWIWGNDATNSCGVGDVYTNTAKGSFTNNPLFISSTNPHLASNSPCINTGSNMFIGATDLDGNQRIWPQAGRVDMGAYEYGSQPGY